MKPNKTLDNHERVILRDACMALLEDISTKKKLWAHSDYAKEINKQCEARKKTITELDQYLRDSNYAVTFTKS